MHNHLKLSNLANYLLDLAWTLFVCILNFFGDMYNYKWDEKISKNLNGHSNDLYSYHGILILLIGRTKVSFSSISIHALKHFDLKKQDAVH